MSHRRHKVIYLRSLLEQRAGQNSGAPELVFDKEHFLVFFHKEQNAEEASKTAHQTAQKPKISTLTAHTSLVTNYRPPARAHALCNKQTSAQTRGQM